MPWKRSEQKKVDERGRDMQMVEERWKMKYEITIGLFSHRECHILGL
jgi:hypothetical protein